MQTLQVFRQPDLKAKDFQFQVRFVQERRSFPAVFGLNQSFQKVVERAFQAFAQHKPMLSWKLAGVIATPQNQVVGLGDDDQFVLLLHRGLRTFANGRPKRVFAKKDCLHSPVSIRLRRVGGKVVKGTR